eukprot:GHVQ01024306.1.p1 GENE.GHVQ01024306.1~~GHVQ01024306.1.p1  ORF type:complete len:116 (+),score=4.80 GHVQ01024306.1:2010-2357(+)
MPVCIINCPVQLTPEAEKELLVTVENGLASVLGKPVKYCMVGYNKMSSMRYGGTDAPTAFCVLHSLGGLQKSINASLSNIVSNALQAATKVPSDRVYIQFYDSKPDFFGYSGATF